MSDTVFRQTHLTTLSTSEFGRIFVEADSERQMLILRAMKKASGEFCWPMQCRYIADEFNGDEADPIADWLEDLVGCLRDRKSQVQSDKVVDEVCEVVKHLIAEEA